MRTATRALRWITLRFQLRGGRLSKLVAGGALWQSSGNAVPTNRRTILWPPVGTFVGSTIQDQSGGAQLSTPTWACLNGRDLAGSRSGGHGYRFVPHLQPVCGSLPPQA